jgi:hypothetical protein
MTFVRGALGAGRIWVAGYVPDATVIAEAG